MKSWKNSVVSGLSLTRAVRWEGDIWTLGSTALNCSLTALTSNFGVLFSKDLSSYYINNRCMWLLIFHIPPCSLPWKAFEVAAGLFPVGVNFSCESCSGCSSVRKQNFPIIIRRSWLAPSDHAATCRDRWWVLIFLQWEGSFAKGSFCNTVCWGSEDKVIIEMKDADLRHCSVEWVGVGDELLGRPLCSVVL